MNVEMTQEFAHECVQVYRQSYPEITSAWRKLEKAAILACQTGLPVYLPCALPRNSK